jgi:hypothetical protein
MAPVIREEVNTVRQAGICVYSGGCEFLEMSFYLSHSSPSLSILSLYGNEYIIEYIMPENEYIRLNRIFYRFINVIPEKKQFFLSKIDLPKDLRMNSYFIQMLSLFLD